MDKRVEAMLRISSQPSIFDSGQDKVLVAQGRQFRGKFFFGPGVDYEILSQPDRS